MTAFSRTYHISRYKRPKMFGGKDFSPEVDIPDLTGKVILVTGGVYALLLRQTMSG